MKKHIKILITGAGGMLGKDIVEIFQNDKSYDIFAVYRGKPVSKNLLTAITLDLTDFTRLKKILQDIEPEIIIHCAAIVNVDLCEKDHRLADALHIEATKILAQCKKTKLIYISTDAVFDGKTGNYQETCRPKPINYYALSKFLGEKEALKNKKSIVIRTNIYGFHVPPANSLVEWAWNLLDKKQGVTGFNDVFFNPVYTKQLARLIKIFVEKKYFSGIINVGSEITVSKFAFLKTLAYAFKMPMNLIKSQSIDGVAFAAKRPKNTILNTKKLQSSLPPISLKDGILEMKQDYYKIFHK